MADPPERLTAELQVEAFFDGVEELPPGALVLARNGAEVDRLALDSGRVRVTRLDSGVLRLFAAFERQAPGWYEAYFEATSSRSRHAFAMIGAAPAVGHGRALIGRGYPGPRFGTRDGDLWFESYAVEPLDQASVYRVEWFHDGALVWSKDEVRPGERLRPIVGSPVWAFNPLTFELPGKAFDGEWQVRYLPATGAGFLARIRLRGGTLEGGGSVSPSVLYPDDQTRAALGTISATLPRSRTADDSTLLVPSAAEVRGWTRSTELISAREAFDRDTSPVGPGTLVFRSRQPGESVTAFIRAYDDFEQHVIDTTSTKNKGRADLARTMSKELSKLVAVHGAQWEADEHPTPGGDVPVVMTE